MSALVHAVSLQARALPSSGHAAIRSRSKGSAGRMGILSSLLQLYHSHRPRNFQVATEPIFMVHLVAAGLDVREQRHS